MFTSVQLNLSTIEYISRPQRAFYNDFYGRYFKYEQMRVQENRSKTVFTNCLLNIPSWKKQTQKKTRNKYDTFSLQNTFHLGTEGTLMIWWKWIWWKQEMLTRNVTFLGNILIYRAWLQFVLPENLKRALILKYIFMSNVITSKTSTQCVQLMHN